MPLTAIICIAWYATCMGSGCLYIEPAWKMNEVPVVLEPKLGPGEEVLHDLDISSVLTVVAADEDSERISAFWIVPGDPTPDFRVEQNGALVTTYVFLAYDTALDGQLVVAHLVDEVSFADVEVPFRIQVGGGFE